MSKFLWVVLLIYFFFMLAVTVNHVNKFADIVVNEIMFGTSKRVCE